MLSDKTHAVYRDLKGDSGFEGFRGSQKKGFRDSGIKNKAVVKFRFKFQALAICAVWMTLAATGWGQILTFDFNGFRGGEAFAMSNANDANLFSSTITRGAGLTATDAWDRFNATSWATTSIENAVSGNKYVEFTITPRAGFRFTVSSITVQWRCSGTGGTQIALRSSVDNYASNLEGVKSVSDSISATTLSWISGFSGSSSSAVTYRLYSYVQNATGQGGPGGGSGNDIVVYGTFTAIPSAPTITRITPGDGQLSVEFTAGSDGGSSIMNYQYSTDGGTSWWYAPTTSPLLITRRSTDGSSLANGTSYNVQIRAVSMHATGTATASIAATPRTTPGAPMILSVTPGNGQLTVSFGAPSSDGGSPITDYEYSINGGSSFTSRLSTSTTFVIGSLMNGSSYNVQVRAVTAAGRGTATSSWAGTPRTTPNAPSINYVTPGNRQISVGFMAGSDGGSAITNYQYSTDGGTSWRTHTSTFSPILITTLSTDGTTALANGTSYNVQLRAVNAAGSGTATSSTAATPRTTPGAPTSLALTPGNGQLTASFFAPSDGGSPITHYEYSINGGSSFTSILSTSTTIVIGSLMNGSSYNVQVRAVNAVGSGTATASVAGTPTAQASQTITFDPLPAVTYSVGATLNLTATASSGLEVSYASSNPAVATVFGNTVNIIGAGTTVITASQAGNTNYNPATSADQTLTVNLASQADVSGNLALATITFGNTTTATASGGTGTGAYEFRQNGGTGSVGFTGTGVSRTITPTAVGTAVIEVRRVADTNYNDSSWVTAGTLTITTETEAPTFRLQIVKVGAATFAGGNTTVTHDFIGVPNQTYLVEYATDLNGPWTSAGNQSTGTTGSFSVNFTTSGDVAADWTAHMYFRARLVR